MSVLQSTAAPCSQTEPCLPAGRQSWHIQGIGHLETPADQAKHHWCLEGSPDVSTFAPVALLTRNAACQALTGLASSGLTCASSSKTASISCRSCCSFSWSRFVRIAYITTLCELQIRDVHALHYLPPAGPGDTQCVVESIPRTLSSVVSTQAMLSVIAGRQRNTSRSRMTAETRHPMRAEGSLVAADDEGRTARLLHTCGTTVIPQAAQHEATVKGAATVTGTPSSDCRHGPLTLSNCFGRVCIRLASSNAR